MSNNINEFDEFDINSGYLSECCGAPIFGEITGGIGICSQCKEWSGVSIDPDFEEKDNG